MQVGTLSFETVVDGSKVTLILEAEDFVYEGEAGLSEIEMLIRKLEHCAESIRQHEDTYDIG